MEEPITESDTDTSTDTSGSCDSDNKLLLTSGTDISPLKSVNISETEDQIETKPPVRNSSPYPGLKLKLQLKNVQLKNIQPPGSSIVSPISPLSARSELKISLEDFVHYLVVKSKSISYKGWLSAEICQRLSDTWLQTENLITDFIYSLAYYRVNPKQLLDITEKAILRIGKVQKQSTLHVNYCKLPFNLLRRVVLERLDWLPDIEPRPQITTKPITTRFAIPKDYSWYQLRKARHYQRWIRKLASKTFPVEMLTMIPIEQRKIRLWTPPRIPSYTSQKSPLITKNILAAYAGPHRKSMIHFFSHILINRVCTFLVQLNLDDYLGNINAGLDRVQTISSKLNDIVMSLNLKLYLCADVKDRAKLINFLIEVCLECYARREHTGCFMLLTIFNSSQLLKLTKTQEKINPRLWAKQLQLAEIMGIYPMDNYMLYHNHCFDLRPRLLSPQAQAQAQAQGSKAQAEIRNRHGWDFDWREGGVYCFPIMTHRLIRFFECRPANDEAERYINPGRMSRFGKYFRILYGWSAVNYLQQHPLKNLPPLPEHIQTSVSNFLEPHRSLDEVLVTQTFQAVLQYNKYLERTNSSSRRSRKSKSPRVKGKETKIKSSKPTESPGSIPHLKNGRQVRRSMTVTESVPVQNPIHGHILARSLNSARPRSISLTAQEGQALRRQRSVTLKMENGSQNRHRHSSIFTQSSHPKSRLDSSDTSKSSVRNKNRERTNSVPRPALGLKPIPRLKPASGKVNPGLRLKVPPDPRVSPLWRKLVTGEKEAAPDDHDEVHPWACPRERGHQTTRSHHPRSFSPGTIQLRSSGLTSPPLGTGQGVVLSFKGHHNPNLRLRLRPGTLSQPKKRSHSPLYDALVSPRRFKTGEVVRRRYSDCVRFDNKVQSPQSQTQTQPQTQPQAQSQTQTQRKKYDDDSEKLPDISPNSKMRRSPRKYHLQRYKLSKSTG